MKPTREQGIQVQSTIEGDVARMSIDANAMQHIMAILTDLYSDPELAVIREYATNAYDAHIEAGVKRPIEVTTPTSLSPYLTIKDYGIGLSVDDIHRIYSQYGASTKRGTDEQVGMLGLGCKSALTYTSQFTVTSRKNGTRISVAVSRDEDGGGSMTVVDTRSTDEPNGVEVTIPTRRGNDFDEKAQWLFRFWKPGTVMLNGRHPTYVSGLRLTDDLLVTKDAVGYRYAAAECYVVMGNVPYPVDRNEYLDWLPYSLGLVVNVPIGSVNFTPSREALHYTNRTKATLNGIRAKYEAAVPGAVQREVDKAGSHSEALTVVAEWSEYLTKQGVSTFVYKGDNLPSDYTVTEADSYGRTVPKHGAIRGTPSNDRYGRLSGCSSLASVPASAWPTTVWIYGYTPTGVDANQKRKMMRWVQDADLTDINQFVLLAEDADPSKGNKFIDPDKCVSWETVRAIKLKLLDDPSRPWKKPRVPGSFDVFVKTASDPADTVGDSVNVTYDQIDQSKPIMYLWGNKWAGKRQARELALHYNAFTLVCLPQNRIEKFKRETPKAMDVDAAIQVKKDAWIKALADDERTAMYMESSYLRDNYKNLNPKRIDDPELQRLAEVARVDVTKHLRKARSFGWSVPPPDGFTDVLKVRYPLTECSRPFRANQRDHVYVYINAVYAATQNKEDSE